MGESKYVTDEAVLKVFTATRAGERNSLGERVTSWLRDNPGLEIVDKTVTQSSDAEFHCIAITLFCRRL